MGATLRLQTLTSRVWGRPTGSLNTEVLHAEEVRAAELNSEAVGVGSVKVWQWDTTWMGTAGLAE